MNDFNKTLRAALLMTISQELPPQIRRKLMMEALKELEYSFSQGDLKAIEEYFNPPEPPQLEVQAKPAFFFSCPLCHQLLLKSETPITREKQKELLRKHSEECITLELFKEVFITR